jgi:hypothetical protein
MSDNEESDNRDLDGDEGLHLLELDEEADRACDDDVRAYYDSLTPDTIGNGWFDQRMTLIHEGLDIENSRTFYNEPRRNYPSPAQLPALHPLRALAWVLEQAPAGSTVRVYCYMMCCPMAIDILIHHGANKTVKIIMNPSGQTTNRLEEFFQDHGRISRRAFRDRLQVRVANVNGANCCGRYTSLHDNSVMTDLHTTFGSYNFTDAARYQNWESLHVADSEPSHAAHFDAIWNPLAGRNVQVVYPALAPASRPRRSPGSPGNKDRATRRQRIC